MKRRLTLEKALIGLLLAQGIPLTFLLALFISNLMTTQRIPPDSELIFLANIICGLMSVIIAFFLIIRKYLATKVVTILSIVILAALIAWLTFGSIGSELFDQSPYDYVIGFSCVVLQSIVLIFLFSIAPIYKKHDGQEADETESIKSEDADDIRESSDRRDELINGEFSLLSPKNTTAIPLSPVIAFGACCQAVFGMICLVLCVISSMSILTAPSEQILTAAPSAADFFMRSLWLFTPFWSGVPILIPAFALWRKHLRTTAILLIPALALAYIPALLTLSIFSYALVATAVAWGYLVVALVMTWGKKSSKSRKARKEAATDEIGEAA